MGKQFQGSKSKARKKAYLERKAKKDLKKQRWERVEKATNIEELADALGLPL